jgi:hypothetical protein
VCVLPAPARATRALCRTICEPHIWRLRCIDGETLVSAVHPVPPPGSCEAWQSVS